MSSVRDVELIPDPARTIEGLRDTGYTFETAVADLVDNSIAAAAEVVDIQVMLDFQGHVHLTITDDGCGMDRRELKRAMTYGSPKRRDPASLGKFGLGLKTASTAFCRRLSVVSRAGEGLSPVMATWDLDHVTNRNRWLLQESDDPDSEAVRRLNAVAGNGSGTVVVWDKVDRLLRQYKTPGGFHHQKALTKKCNDLREHLEMTFERFLDDRDDRARDLKIILNGRSVVPWDPFQKDLSDLAVEDKKAVILEEDGKESEAEFVVRAFILPRRADFPSTQRAKAAKLGSNRQGMYIYREQRLIHAGSWLKMFKAEPHFSLLRVEFSFDHRLDQAFHLDVKKSQILLNDDLVKWLRDSFLPAPRREADRRYRHGVRKVSKEKARGAHDGSNRAIGNKEAVVGGPRVEGVGIPGLSEHPPNRETYRALPLRRSEGRADAQQDGLERADPGRLRHPRHQRTEAEATQHHCRPHVQRAIPKESKRGQEALLRRTVSVERDEDVARPRNDPVRFAHDRLDLPHIGHEVDYAGRNDDGLIGPISERHRGRIRANQGQASAQPGVFHHLGAQIDAVASQPLTPKLLDDQPLPGTDDHDGWANVAKDQTHARHVQVVVFEAPVMRCHRVPVGGRVARGRRSVSLGHGPSPP